MGFAMSVADLCWVRDYFRFGGEIRALTELKVIDTYWSDHCRHTTFSTKLDTIEIEDGRYKKAIEDALNQYFEIRKEVYGNREKMFALWIWRVSELRFLKARFGYQP